MRFVLLLLLSCQLSDRLKCTKIKTDNRYPASAVNMHGLIWVPQHCARIMFCHLSISVDLGLGHRTHSTCLYGMSGILPLLPKTIDDEQPTRWSGTTTHPYGDVTALKVPSQYEFTAALRSLLDAKAVPADTGLKLLAAAMRNRKEKRGCLERCIVIFVVFCWMLYSCK